MLLIHAHLKLIFHSKLQFKKLKLKEVLVFLSFSVIFLNKNSMLKEKKRLINASLTRQTQDMTNYGTILNFMPVPKWHIFSDRLVIIIKNFPRPPVMKKHITDKHINLSTQHNVKP